MVSLLNVFHRQLSRQLSRNALLYLLFPSLFTAGFILGSLYSSSLNSEINKKSDILLDSSLLQNVAYLIVVIFSSPENFDRRQTIRKTWLNTKGNYTVKHYFALSVGSLNHKKLTSLKDEHSSYKDLLFLYSFSDSYLKLSEKLREVLRWIDKNNQYKFLLKVDDDSFVQIQSLSDKLSTLPQEKLYWGFFDGHASIKTKGKWKEKNWFLCDRYLPYAKGGGYLLSQDLIQLIVSVSDYLTLYHNEDVSLGTWLAPYDINRIHEPNFDTDFESRGCFNSYLVTHKQTMPLMEEKYNNLLNIGSICQSEYRLKDSYVYNWNVLPSHCCVKSDKVP